jgi:hypothetical protein
LCGSIKINPYKVGDAQQRKGYFIIATNELNSNHITAEQLLSVYKAQGVSVEKGVPVFKGPHVLCRKPVLEITQKNHSPHYGNGIVPACLYVGGKEIAKGTGRILFNRSGSKRKGHFYADTPLDIPNL